MIRQMVCSKCNHEYADELDRCPICGEPNPNQAQQSAWGQQSAQNSNGWQTQQSRQTQHDSYSAGTQTSDTSGSQTTRQAMPPAPLGAPAGANPSTILIMGILSLLFPFIGVVLGILAIVWGSRARKTYLPGDANYAIANAGWVLGIVGLVWQALMVVYLVLVFAMVNTILQSALTYGSNPFDYYAF